MNNRWSKIILMPLFIAALSGCHIYRGVPIEGWVVDEETKQPIKDAVVVAVWETKGGLVHYDIVGNLMAKETLTDDKGHFVFDLWGPKFVFWNELDSTAPTLVFFHKDYYFWITGNGNLKPPPAFTNETRGSVWNGKMIALKRFDGNWEEYEQNARIAEFNLHSNSSSWLLRCTWEKMPRLTAEILRREEIFRQKNILTALPREDSLGYKCSDPKKALEDYR